MRVKTYDWLVVGAGAAGILAVGRLLDEGVRGDKIAWVDPAFNAGDLGDKWFNVPSNTLLLYFIEYFKEARSFNFSAYAQMAELDAMDLHKTCKLSVVANVLKWITAQLRQQVTDVEGMVEALSHDQAGYCAQLSNGDTMVATKAVLALGANARVPDFHNDSKTSITLDVALNPELLKNAVGADDNVLVYGASHSAVLILRSLCDMGIDTVNIYNAPLRFAKALPEGGYLYDNTGLKGEAALWAKENLLGDKPACLTRLLFDGEAYEKAKASCNKVIYAIGFNARKIKLAGFNDYAHNMHVGEIAPDLYGFGIAHPQLVRDKFGIEEVSVGMFKFVKYLRSVLPLWMS